MANGDKKKKKDAVDVFFETAGDIFSGRAKEEAKAQERLNQQKEAAINRERARQADIENTKRDEILRQREIAEPEIIRSQETGAPTFIRTNRGVFPSEAISSIVQATGQQPVEATAAREAALGGVLGQQLGTTQPDLLGVQPSEISQAQAIQAGLGAAIPGAVTGLAAGAFIGKGGGSLVTAPIGALLGAAKSFYSGYQANIKSQTADQVSSSVAQLRDADAELKTIISAVWAGGDKTFYADRFQFILDEVDRQEAQLLLDVRNGVNLLVQEDGTIELNRYETFRTISRPQLIAEMRIALSSVAPNNQKAITWLDSAGKLDLNNIEG